MDPCAFIIATFSLDVIVGCAAFAFLEWFANRRSTRRKDRFIRDFRAQSKRDHEEFLQKHKVFVRRLGCQHEPACLDRLLSCEHIDARRAKS